MKKDAIEALVEAKNNYAEAVRKFEADTGVGVCTNKIEIQLMDAGYFKDEYHVSLRDRDSDLYPVEKSFSCNGIMISSIHNLKG